MSRFSNDYELRRIDRGLRLDGQNDWGTKVRWYRFDTETTVVDDVYDQGAPRAYSSPFEVPVLWAVRTEGRSVPNNEGLQSYDALELAVRKSVLRDDFRWPLHTRADAESFLRDRIEYEGRVFAINVFDIQGQLQDSDVIIGVGGREIQSYDLPFEPEFLPDVEGRRGR